MSTKSREQPDVSLCTTVVIENGELLHLIPRHNGLSSGGVVLFDHHLPLLHT